MGNKPNYLKSKTLPKRFKRWAVGLGRALPIGAGGEEGLRLHHRVRRHRARREAEVGGAGMTGERISPGTRATSPPLTAESGGSRTCSRSSKRTTQRGASVLAEAGGTGTTGEAA